MFFTKNQKALALKKRNSLKREYELSESYLILMARKGDEKELIKAMAYHHDIEYAYLYTFTPEYYEKIKESFKK